MESLRVDHYIHQCDEQIDSKLNEVLRLLKRFMRSEDRKDSQMSKQLDDLKAKVASGTTVGKSVLVLIAALVAAKDNPQELQALIDELDASQTEVAAAVAANTEASGEPPVAP